MYCIFWPTNQVNTPCGIIAAIGTTHREIQSCVKFVMRNQTFALSVDKRSIECYDFVVDKTKLIIAQFSAWVSIFCDCSKQRNGTLLWLQKVLCAKSHFYLWSETITCLCMENAQIIILRKDAHPCRLHCAKFTNNRNSGNVA